MSNTYTYKVTNLVRDQDGIVVTAQFTITADDGVDSFTHSYSTGFANQPATPTPFADLTEAKVIEWIKRDAGAENQFEQSADAELVAYKQRKAEPVLSSGTPWAPDAQQGPIIPRSVTMRQARLALKAAGLLAAVQAAVAAAGETAQIEWEYSNEVQRNSGLVPALAASLGLTGAQIDALFLAAAAIAP